MSTQQHIFAIASDRAQRVASMFALAVVLSLAGCQGTPDEASPDPGNTSETAAPIGSAPAAASATPTVPGNIEDGNCTDAERPAAPDACAWAGSTDAIVWGVLKEINLVESPAVAAWNVADKWQWAQDCDAVNPALELVVDVQRVLAGDRAVLGTLSVKIGTRQRERFDPMPVLDAKGALAWEKVGASKGGPLVVGQPIGLPLHYVPEFQIWSLMGESPFILDPGGRVAFQDRRGHCSEPAPAAIAGLALDSFGRSLASCAQASAAGNARRARMRKEWGAAQDPTAFMAAACFQRQPGPRAGECMTSSDCVGGQGCVAGVCRGS